MNINTNQTQSGVMIRRMYHQDNKKNAPAATEKNKSAGDSLIENIKKSIEDKKKQIQEVKMDDSLSEKLKEAKLDNLQNQLQELQERLNQAIIDKQKREAEELVRRQNEKTEEKNNDGMGNTQTQRFINTFTKVAFGFDSIQQSQITKAEKERDSTRIEIEMKNDAKRGIIGDKADELYKTEVASNRLDKEIEEKTSDINEEIKEYREKEIEESKKAESEKSEDEKTEEKVFGNTEEELSAEETLSPEASSEISADETSEEISKKENPLYAIYNGNSFDNYLEKESSIDTNC